MDLFISADKTYVLSGITLEASVNQLKSLVYGATGIPPAEQRLVFNARELDTGTISLYNLLEGSTVTVLAKLYGGSKRISEKDIKGTELKLTKDMCLIAYDDDPYTWRVLMPCGHAFTPDSLTAHLSDYFKNSTKSVILCPKAIGEGAANCSPWSYPLVRQAAMLTKEECKIFEPLCERNWIMSHPGNLFVACPQCHSMGSNDRALERVACVVCQRAGRRSDFCSRCLRTWEDLKGRCKTCANNPGPINHLLANSPTKEIGTSGTLKNIPMWRSCPRWEDHPYPVLIEHKERCKHIPCPNCKKWFCFVCLAKADTKGGYPCGGPFDMCPSKIAPPQVFKQIL